MATRTEKSASSIDRNIEQTEAPRPAEISGFRRQLRRLERSILLHMQRDSACCGVTIPQCHTLLAMADSDGPSTVNTLAAELGVDKSTMSRTVDGLVKDGLVDRRVNPDNRRSQILTLTPGGRKACDDIDANCNDYYGALFARFPANDRTAFQDAIATLNRLLEISDTESDLPSCPR